VSEGRIEILYQALLKRPQRVPAGAQRCHGGQSVLRRKQCRRSTGLSQQAAAPATRLFTWGKHLGHFTFS